MTVIGSIDLSGSTLSKDILEFDRKRAGLAGGTNADGAGLSGPSSEDRGLAVFVLVRCCSVDFLKLNGLRCGDFCRLGEASANVGSLACGLDASARSLFPSKPSSKTLKSLPNAAACRLRLLALGLPMVGWSRFITPSLRFNGLDFAGVR